MTDLVTGERPDQVDPETERTTLLGEVREAVLSLLADLPTPPGRIRISASDIAVELDWPAAAPSVAPPAVGPVPVVPPVATQPVPGEPVPPPVEPGPPPPGEHQVNAAIVGTFYRAPEPGSPPFVEVGDPVHAGQQLAIIEAMKLMIPVESDVDGKVREVLKSDGQPVEFGEPLFAIGRD